MRTTIAPAASLRSRQGQRQIRGAGLCIVGLSVAVLGLFSAAAHAQDGVATYESPINGFSFQYPADWQIGPIPVEVSTGNVIERVGLSAPDGAIGLISVIQLNARLSDADVPVLKFELDTAFEAGAAQVGGEVVLGEIFDATDFGLRYLFAYQINFPRDGRVIASRQYAFVLADRQYNIALEADEAGHERHQGVLEGILRSFWVDER
ncbi:MAG: hypothetical protein HW416_546 [Chloroflexi bacterium]|nr:hypothetical protein [Chloroflexota bacterium]